MARSSGSTYYSLKSWISIEIGWNSTIYENLCTNYNDFETKVINTVSYNKNLKLKTDKKFHISYPTEKGNVLTICTYLRFKPGAAYT